MSESESREPETPALDLVRRVEPQAQRIALTFLEDDEWHQDPPDLAALRYTPSHLTSRAARAKGSLDVLRRHGSTLDPSAVERRRELVSERDSLTRAVEGLERIAQGLGARRNGHAPVSHVDVVRNVALALQLHIADEPTNIIGRLHGQRDGSSAGRLLLADAVTAVNVSRWEAGKSRGSRATYAEFARGTLVSIATDASTRVAALDSSIADLEVSEARAVHVSDVIAEHERQQSLTAEAAIQLREVWREVLNEESMDDAELDSLVERIVSWAQSDLGPGRSDTWSL